MIGMIFLYLYLKRELKDCSNLIYFSCVLFFFLSFRSRIYFIVYILVFSLLPFLLLDEKFLQFDGFRAVVFQLNLKYLHLKITNLLWVVV